MTQRRLVYNMLFGAGLAAVFAGLWWSVRRLGPAAVRLKSSGERPVLVASHPSGPPAKAPEPPPGPGSGPALSAEAREWRDLRAKVVASHQSLAAAQIAALDAVPESGQTTALIRFSESARQARSEAGDSMERFLQRVPAPGASSKRMPEAEAALVRFAAVRRALIDEGVPLEEAESRFARASARP